DRRWGPRPDGPPAAPGRGAPRAEEAASETGRPAPPDRHKPHTAGFPLRQPSTLPSQELSREAKTEPPPHDRLAGEIARQAGKVNAASTFSLEMTASRG